MDEKISFTMEEDLLPVVGTLHSGEKSPLSLLKGTKKQIPADSISRLRSRGIVDASDKIKSEFEHAVETLARTSTFARLKFSAGKTIFEFIVYFPEDQTSPVSLTHNAHEIIVHDPAAIDDIFDLIDQNVGHSGLLSVQFSGEFSHEEALALCAMLDLERNALLRRLAGGTEPVQRAYNLPQITSWAGDKKKSYQSFEFVVQSRIGLSSPPTPQQIQNGLLSLAAKGHVLRPESKFQLNETLENVAGRFPIIDNFAIVETVKLVNNKTLWAGSFISLQAGVNDLLYLESIDGKIIIRCITGLELLNLVARSLSDPDYIKVPSEPLPAPSSPELPKKGSFCSKCGAPIRVGKQFCAKCGEKVTTPTMESV